MYLSNTGFIYMYCNTINCNSYIYNFCSFFLSLKKVCLWQYSRQSQLHWWLRIQWGDPWSLQLLTGCQQIWLCCQLWFCQMLEHWSRSSQISTLAHAVNLNKEWNRLYYGLIHLGFTHYHFLLSIVAFLERCIIYVFIPEYLKLCFLYSWGLGPLHIHKQSLTRSQALAIPLLWQSNTGNTCSVSTQAQRNLQKI